MESGLGPDLYKWSRSWSQIFGQGLDHPVRSLAKMGKDRTRPNFPNTSERCVLMYQQARLRETSCSGCSSGSEAILSVAQ